MQPVWCQHGAGVTPTWSRRGSDMMPAWSRHSTDMSAFCRHNTFMMPAQHRCDADVVPDHHRHDAGVLKQYQMVPWLSRHSADTSEVLTQPNMMPAKPQHDAGVVPARTVCKGHRPGTVQKNQCAQNKERSGGLHYCVPRLC